MQNYIAYKYSGENRFYSDGKFSGGAAGVLKEDYCCDRS
jgi:hypothetical protein